jgi:hypothetical protein
VAKAKPVARHPIQPLVKDQHGVVRFKQNTIVNFLAKERLNELAAMDFPKEDWDQFYQLIGYSHGGIPEINEEIWESADAMYNLGQTEQEARAEYLRGLLSELREGLKEPVARLYSKHVDDFL